MLCVLLCSALLAADPPATAPTPADLATYHAADARAGRDAEAHVALALWCEARGMSAERVKHLALAILADPKNVAARGLMGLVEDGGKWRRPEDVASAARSDEKRSEAQAQYVALREKTPATADAQWKLSTWCDKHGLRPQAEAHARAVTRLDPSRKAAWERLGCRNVGGRWLTEAQITAERHDLEDQAKADRKWLPKLSGWRDDLRDRGRHGRAEVALAGVTDPRAVSSIARVFGTSDPADQARLVQLLGQIAGGPASRLLATAALYGDSPEVRRAAMETLARRDARDFAEVVIGQIRDLLKFEVKPVNGPDSPGVLMVEGKDFILRRRYTPPSLPEATRQLIDQRASGVLIGAVIRNPSSPAQVNVRAAFEQREFKIANDLSEVQRAGMASQQQLADDLARVRRENELARALNDRAVVVLSSSTGGDLGPDREGWKKWWTEHQGYAYVSPPTSPTKPVFEQQIPSSYQPNFAPPLRPVDCLAAGTPIRTREGDRPIETLQVGDMLLAQDTLTGRLAFEPITAVYHNAPAATLEVALDKDRIVVTGIHRFWSAGKGWVMARDLKPGDVIRTVGGTSRVESVDPKKVQPVFNLDVARGRSFFVGTVGALVHDNTLVETTPEPFDAVK